MKLGEIKLEALRLMFMNYNDDLSIEDFESYLQNENYASYLVNMNGSINRCFSSIEEKGVLPSKSHTLTLSEGTVSGAFIRFDLSTILNDYSSIDRVIYENDNGEYNGEYDYKLEGDVLVLDRIDEDETYTLLYKPSISRITNETSKTQEITIPDNIACLIPYFIKGDLYRDDEPNEASEARNWFEASMDSIIAKRVNNFSKVHDKYSQTEI